MISIEQLIQRVIERLQIDIDSGSRPDQWSMESMQRDLKHALEGLELRRQEPPK